MRIRAQLQPRHSLPRKLPGRLQLGRTWPLLPRLLFLLRYPQLRYLHPELRPDLLRGTYLCTHLEAVCNLAFRQLSLSWKM